MYYRQMLPYLLLKLNGLLLQKLLCQHYFDNQSLTFKSTRISLMVEDNFLMDDLIFKVNSKEV